jgi:exodeoxyribonuclease VIII
MNPGIYDDIPNEDYHNDSALSRSGLVNFARSPEYYQWRLRNPIKSTPAMDFGTHVHARILEPTRHREIYVSAPEGMKKTAKKKWEEFEKDHPGKTVVTFDEMETVNAIAASVGKSETASALLSGGKAEQSVFWENPVHGFMCKCRPDYLKKKHKIIVDLKTASDISPEAFSRSVANFKYHFQATHYLAGCEAVMPGEYESFVFVCVESKAPHQVAIYVLDQESLNLAEVEMVPLLSRYAQCLEYDNWPGIPDEISVVSLPGWAKNSILFD